MTELQYPTHLRKSLFIHIPKTAGISLFSCLREVYGDSQSRRWGGGVTGHLREYLETPDSELQKLSFISGHLHYSQFLRKNFGKRLVFTVLREPIERLLSEYYYVCGWTEHPHHAKIANMTFDDYFAFTVERGFANLQCQFLCAEATFPAAIQSFLSNIDLIGISERMNLFMSQLGRSISAGESGYEELTLPRQNITVGSRLRRHEVDNNLLVRMLAANLEDYKLWTYVVDNGGLLVNDERLRSNNGT